jgi:hypothetical protein
MPGVQRRDRIRTNRRKVDRMTTLGWTLYAPIAAIVLIVLIVLAAMAYDLTPLGDWTDRLLAGSRDMGDELDEIRFDWPDRDDIAA